MVPVLGFSRTDFANRYRTLHIVKKKCFPTQTMPKVTILRNGPIKRYCWLKNQNFNKLFHQKLVPLKLFIFEIFNDNDF